MRHSSTIASFLAAPLFALCLMFMGIALTGTAAAAQMEQTITLQPGWNAIHIALEPEEKEIGTIFAGLPIKSVWRWIPGRGQAQFIRDPSEGLENVDGWFGWFPEPRPEAFLTNLFTIDANISYLVRLDESAGTRQIVIRGKPRFVPTAWMADGFTLTGLPVTRDDPPTFAEFFSRSAAHEGQPIYRLTPAGQWQLVSAPAATVIRADEAYWIYTKGNSSYQGRMGVIVDSGESLDFDGFNDELRIVLRNNSGANGSFQIERLSGDAVPLSLRLEDPETGEIGWPDLQNVEAFDAPADADVFVVLAIKRAQFTQERMEQMIAITDELGDRVVLRVAGKTAHAGTADLMGHGVGARGNGDPDPEAMAGLWIGELSIANVSEAQMAGTEPKPVFEPFVQRVLIHVNAQGQARLLKDVIQMWEEGTMRPSSVNPAYQEVDQPGHYVLITNKNLIGLYSGVTGRDGVPVGIRFSTVAYDFAGETLEFAGLFGPGGQITTAILVTPDLPTNPFLHRYHPDHNNLDEQYLNHVDEAYQVVRNLELTFTDNEPTGATNPVGWGDSVVGGTFAESITGLHRNAIFTSGTFRLRRASAVPVLNQ